MIRRLIDQARARRHTPVTPRRDDEFATWLKMQRDKYPENTPQWVGVDGVLDFYRLHADTGTPLDAHVCEGRVVGDCECLEVNRV